MAAADHRADQPPATDRSGAVDGGPATASAPTERSGDGAPVPALAPEEPSGASPSPSGRRLRPGFRLRVLGFAAALLVGATVAGLFVQRAVLVERLDRQINDALDLERDELESLVGGRDPATGEPFGGDVEAIFETFLNRNVPTPGQA